MKLEELVDLDDLVNTITSISERHPHKRIPDEGGCMYFKVRSPEEPECIVGTALVELGVTRDQLRQAFVASASLSLNPGYWNTSQFNKYFPEGRIDPRVAWVTAVQRKQDAGETWGTAVFES